MRVSTLITFLLDFQRQHGDAEITALELPRAPVRAALETVLGSDDSSGAGGPVYIITTRTGVAETFDSEEEPTLRSISPDPLDMQRVIDYNSVINKD